MDEDAFTNKMRTRMEEIVDLEDRKKREDFKMAKISSKKGRGIMKRMKVS